MVNWLTPLKSLDNYLFILRLRLSRSFLYTKSFFFLDFRMGLAGFIDLFLEPDFGTRTFSLLSSTGRFMGGLGSGRYGAG